jgi:hypothetical protein
MVVLLNLQFCCKRKIFGLWAFEGIAKHARGGCYMAEEPRTWCIAWLHSSIVYEGF